MTDEEGRRGTCLLLAMNHWHDSEWVTNKGKKNEKRRTPTADDIIATAKEFEAYIEGKEE